MRLFSQIKKGYSSKAAIKDIFSGIVVALVSIPISMGYSQIAGLPSIYGLYGSLLPILVYGLLTTSRQFVVGVDAMPAVMVGGMLAQLGIMAETKEAMRLVPVISLLTALWFFAFYVLKAGRIVKYISTPVMGGFISGVGLTIIMMQVPKLFGGTPGTGEIIVLLQHIWNQRENFHLLSLCLGAGTVVIILVCKKLIPKVPMTIIMLVIGGLLQVIFKLDRYGVKLMAPVESGLPKLIIPDIKVAGDNFLELIMLSLGIAGVIMAQTLLASGNYAKKYHVPMDNNAELLAYGAMNVAAGVTGCCPINGSVSRSGIADSQGTKSQLMSVSAALTMVLVLFIGTPLIKYLPVPILTGIVITALIGILEFDLAKRLWKSVRNEWFIFMIALLAVLLFGTINGVIIGVVLSFWEVAIRAVNPPTALMGRIPGHGNFHSLKRNSTAKPIKNTVIYRFGGNLFFANIDLFCREIEEALKDDTKQIVVDARGIGNIDITAAERLVMFHKELKNRGIKFYLTEHDGSLNDQLKKLGAESLIEEGAVRHTITLALKDAGLEKPYTLEENTEMEKEKKETFFNDSVEEKALAAEREWLHGKADGSKS